MHLVSEGPGIVVTTKLIAGLLVRKICQKSLFVYLAHNNILTETQESTLHLYSLCKTSLSGLPFESSSDYGILACTDEKVFPSFSPSFCTPES